MSTNLPNNGPYINGTTLTLPVQPGQWTHVGGAPGSIWNGQFNIPFPSQSQKLVLNKNDIQNLFPLGNLPSVGDKIFPIVTKIEETDGQYIIELKWV